MASLKHRVLQAADCPSRLLLDELADKWSVLILAALKDGPLRFNEIKRTLEGITQKALTQTLRRAQRHCGQACRRGITYRCRVQRYGVG